MLVRLIGWKATILHGDALVLERWRWLRRHLKSGRLRTLDAGCGSGAFTMHAAKIGNEAIGISKDEQNNQKARVRSSILKISNVGFITADLRNLDNLNEQLGRFEQIICLETIEHIGEDKKFIMALANLLKPGGRLLLTTPFKHRRQIFGEEIPGCADGGHIKRGYTHKELSSLFNQCGLDIAVKEFIGGFITQQLVQLMRVLSTLNPGFGWAATFPLRILQLFDSPLNKMINKISGYPYFTIGIVGTKRA